MIQLHNPVASLNTKTWNLNHNRLDYVFQFNTPSKSICVNQEHHSNTRINQLLTNFPFSIGLTFILPSTLITQTQMLAWVFCIHCFTKFKCKHKFWVVVLGVRERKEREFGYSFVLKFLQINPYNIKTNKSWLGKALNDLLPRQKWIYTRKEIHGLLLIIQTHGEMVKKLEFNSYLEFYLTEDGKFLKRKKIHKRKKIN